MKKFKCDLCKKEVEDEYKLQSLIPSARPRLYDIKDLCPECMGEVNKVNAKIEAILEKARHNWLQKIITMMFEKRNKS